MTPQLGGKKSSGALLSEVKMQEDLTNIQLVIFDNNSFETSVGLPMGKANNKSSGEES
jgi:hypothetical protein